MSEVSLPAHGIIQHFSQNFVLEEWGNKVHLQLFQVVFFF